MRALALVLTVAFAVPALAEEPAAAPVPEVSAPPAPPAAEPTLPPAFFQRSLHVDAAGQASVGTERRPLSRLELFTLTGRTDLVQRSAENRARRFWYAAASVGTGLATVGVAALLFLTGPDLLGARCTADPGAYNACVAGAQAHQTGAFATLAVGGIATVALATLAALADPEVLSRDEAVALASRYNAQLARSLKQQGVRLVPWVGPGQAGLMASFPLP